MFLDRGDVDGGLVGSVVEKKSQGEEQGLQKRHERVLMEEEVVVHQTLFYPDTEASFLCLCCLDSPCCPCCPCCRCPCFYLCRIDHCLVYNSSSLFCCRPDFCFVAMAGGCCSATMICCRLEICPASLCHSYRLLIVVVETGCRHLDCRTEKKRRKTVDPRAFRPNRSLVEEEDLAMLNGLHSRHRR